MIPNGSQVTWSSQSQGSHTTKSGEVIEFVPAGQNIQSDLSHKKPYQLKFGNQLKSKNDRYLVKVSVTNAKRTVYYYYCPRASVVRSL